MSCNTMSYIALAAAIAVGILFGRVAEIEVTRRFYVQRQGRLRWEPLRTATGSDEAESRDR